MEPLTSRNPKPAKGLHTAFRMQSLGPSARHPPTHESKQKHHNHKTTTACRVFCFLACDLKGTSRMDSLTCPKGNLLEAVVAPVYSGRLPLATWIGAGWRFTNILSLVTLFRIPREPTRKPRAKDRPRRALRWAEPDSALSRAERTDASKAQPFVESDLGKFPTKGLARVACFVSLGLAYFVFCLFVFRRLQSATGSAGRFYLDPASKPG